MIFSFTIPDAQVPTLRDGFCQATGYTVSSGLTKEQWIKTATIKWWKALAVVGLDQINERDVVKPQVDGIGIT